MASILMHGGPRCTTNEAKMTENQKQYDFAGQYVTNLRIRRKKGNNIMSTILRTTSSGVTFYKIKISNTEVRMT